MNYVQLVSPNLNQESGAGWCLKFSQDAFRAPVMHPSATDAANATKYRHATREMPSVAVPVWFDHWGTYQGRYANWGHVVVWVPGRGFLSSPGSGFGQLWLPSIEAVERTFNAKYRFWSEDINTLRVAQPASNSSTSPASKTPGALRRKRRRNNMLIFVYLHHGAGKENHQFAVYEHGKPGTWWEFSGQSSANQLATQLGGAMALSKNTWDDRKKKHS